MVRRPIVPCSRRFALAAGLAAALAPLASARAEAVVHVTLEDPSDPGVKRLRMIARPPAVPSGEVRLVVHNASKDMMHEVLVTPWSERPLPYDKAAQKVIEARIRILGAVEDLKPGAGGVARMKLRAGKYLLFCNQPGHYRTGMWTSLVVRP